MNLDVSNARLHVSSSLRSIIVFQFSDLLRYKDDEVDVLHDANYVALDSSPQIQLKTLCLSR